MNFERANRMPTFIRPQTFTRKISGKQAATIGNAKSWKMENSIRPASKRVFSLCRH